jgi:hypothetical protein
MVEPALPSLYAQSFPVSYLKITFGISPSLKLYCFSAELQG